MKVLKEGKDMKAAAIKQKSCKRCGCEFEYSPNDVNSSPRGDCYVICPNETCKHFIEV